MSVWDMFVVFMDSDMFGGDSLASRESQICKEGDCSDEGGENMEDPFWLEVSVTSIPVDQGIRGNSPVEHERQDYKTPGKRFPSTL